MDLTKIRVRVLLIYRHIRRAIEGRSVVNFQQKVVSTDPSIQGHINEARFFDIMKTMLLSGDHPEWLVDVHRATHQEDRMGIDGFAIIHFPDGSLRGVPFQVKSSHAYLEEYIALYKVCWMDRIRFFFSNPKQSDARIRREFLDELKTIYRNNERFDRILDYIKTGEYVSPYERMVYKTP